MIKLYVYCCFLNHLDEMNSKLKVGLICRRNNKDPMLGIDIRTCMHAWLVPCFENMGPKQKR